jgi:hypothetical protein
MATATTYGSSDFILSQMIILSHIIIPFEGIIFYRQYFELEQETEKKLNLFPNQTRSS